MNTNNVKVYNDIASLLQTNIDKLVPGYSYGGNGINFLAQVQLSSIIGKMVIMVKNDDNHTLENSLLYEYTNVIIGGDYYHYNAYSDVANGNVDDLVTFNKMHTTYVYPDTEDNTPTNPDVTKCKIAGTQFIGMSYQTLDNNLKAYESIFSNYAFIMKEKDLLPVTDSYTTSGTSGNALPRSYEIAPGIVISSLKRN
jgi:hypothetical protein